MSLYNNSSSFSSSFYNYYQDIFSFLLNFSSFMPLPFLKFLPFMILSLAFSESVISSDLASFIAPFLDINFDSASKNIHRFLSNKNYDFDFFFHKFISFLLSSYEIKHSDNRIHIAFDHMFVEKRFTVLMFSLKIGKQSITIWFKTFDFNDSSAFQFDLFKSAINYCHNLFKSIIPDSNIIFLADRFWGNHFKLMGYIESLNDTYIFRAKGNVVAFVFDKKEGHTIKTPLSNIPPYVFKSKVIQDIKLSFNRFKTNLVISKSIDHVEPFYLLTNGDYKRAIKDYSYRFGSIEFLFKSQKSNGFFLEETQIKDLYSFNSLYTCICISNIFMTLLGIDFAKNKLCYKEIKIRNARIVNGKRVKDYSFFHIGLLIFKLSFLSNLSIRIFKKPILYDV